LLEASSSSSARAAHSIGIAVASRRVLSGIAYNEEDGAAVSFWLRLGAAMSAGTVDDLIRELTVQREQHTHLRPGGALPGALDHSS
jgi:hypothetical protein